MVRKKPKDTEFFKYHNANPEDKRASDCVIRSLCVAMDKSWLEVFDALNVVARRLYDVANAKAVYAAYLAEEGWVKKARPKKRVTATKFTLYTVSEFLMEMWYKDLNIPMVVHVGSGHLVCIKDRKVLDIWNSSKQKLGSVWVSQAYSDTYDSFIAYLDAKNSV